MECTCDRCTRACRASSHPHYVCIMSYRAIQPLEGFGLGHIYKSYVQPPPLGLASFLLSTE